MQREWNSVFRATMAIVCLSGVLALCAGPANAQPVKAGEAHELQAKGRAAQKAGDDRGALELFNASVSAGPSVSALVDLAYLQATSDDPTVRNAKAASITANEAMTHMQNYLQQEMSGTLAASHPGVDLKSAFLNMKACVFNAYAAARAAGSDFIRAQTFMEQSLHAAQALAAKEPTSGHQEMIHSVLTNQVTIQTGQALHGTAPLSCNFID